MGRLLKVGYAYYSVTSVLAAEARAMRDGVYVAVEAAFKHILIEGGNKIVMQALKGIIKVPRQIQSLIKDVLMWKEKGIHIIINQVFRETNMAVD